MHYQIRSEAKRSESPGHTRTLLDLLRDLLDVEREVRRSGGSGEYSCRTPKVPVLQAGVLVVDTTRARVRAVVCVWLAVGEAPRRRLEGRGEQDVLPSLLESTSSRRLCLLAIFSAFAVSLRTSSSSIRRSSFYNKKNGLEYGLT